MRFAIGGISHETNTFSPIRTDLALFERRGVHGPDTLIDAFAGTRTILGGFLDAARTHGFEVVPTILAEAAPSGVVAADALDRLTEQLVDALHAAGPLDGVLLELHGAMVAENARDGDAEVLAQVRAAVGDVPIAIVTDLHANLSEAMAEQADLLVGYDTYPHIDMYERAVEAVELLVRVMRGELRPVKALRKPPLLPPLPKQCTTYDTPMRALVELAHRRERDAGIVSITVAAGFPYADVPEAGLGVLVTTDDDVALAERVADEIAALAWERREEFVIRCTSVEEALRIAAEAGAGEGTGRSSTAGAERGPGGADRSPAGPVVLADTADNPGAGAACDGTVLLRGLLQRGVQGAALAALWDPEAVALCRAEGVGGHVELLLGGKTDDLHGEPLEVHGYVKLLSDGRFKNHGPMNTGAETRMGPTAVLVCDGVEVVVTSNRVQALDAGVFLSQGIDPASKRVLILKSSVHFRGAFEPIAARVVEVDTPGLSNSDLSRYAYRHVRRPIFPLDAL